MWRISALALFAAGPAATLASSLKHRSQPALQKMARLGIASAIATAAALAVAVVAFRLHETT